MNKLQKAFGIGALAIGLIGCHPDYPSEKNPKRIELEVGEYSPDVIYCGMINDKIFSLSDRPTMGTNASRVNFFYPINSKTIYVNSEKFNIIKVSPEHITLDFLGFD